MRFLSQIALTKIEFWAVHEKKNFLNNAPFQILTSLSCVSEDLDCNNAIIILGSWQAVTVIIIPQGKQSILETLGPGKGRTPLSGSSSPQEGGEGIGFCASAP